MNSCLYVGQVSHRRYMPRDHAFEYRLFMLYLNLDELPGLFDHTMLWSARGFNLAWFRREDHLGDSTVSLKESVLQEIDKQTGHRPLGPVYLLTHVRYAGFGFNPVSFYYCFDDPEATRPAFIVAEVSNTPWRERHAYVIKIRPEDNTNTEYQMDKQFHVSPFLPIDMQYRWRFDLPDQFLAVYIQNWRKGSKYFDACLNLERRPLNSGTLNNMLLQFPLMTAKVVVGIYYEAFRLWLKKTPFYSHSLQTDSVVQENKK